MIDLLILIFRIALFLMSLGSVLAGVLTFAPGHELRSIFWIVLAIWLSLRGGRTA